MVGWLALVSFVHKCSLQQSRSRGKSFIPHFFLRVHVRFVHISLLYWWSKKFSWCWLRSIISILPFKHQTASNMPCHSCATTSKWRIVCCSVVCIMPYACQKRRGILLPPALVLVGECEWEENALELLLSSEMQNYRNSGASKWVSEGNVHFGMITLAALYKCITCWTWQPKSILY